MCFMLTYFHRLLQVSTSEEESRANNSTRAELFAGLLRGFLCQSNDALKNAPSSSIAGWSDTATS